MGPSYKGPNVLLLEAARRHVELEGEKSCERQEETREGGSRCMLWRRLSLAGEGGGACLQAAARGGCAPDFDDVRMSACIRTRAAHAAWRPHCVQVQNGVAGALDRDVPAKLNEVLQSLPTRLEVQVRQEKEQERTGLQAGCG
jgi:hypothetical protein